MKKISCFLILFLFLFVQNSFSQSTYLGNIVFEGNNRVSSDTIKKELNVKNSSVVRSNVSEYIKKLYALGYFSDVRASLLPGDVIKFTVVEKPILRKLMLEGNKELEDSDLKEALKFDDQSRFIDKLVLDSAKKALITVYQMRGYYDINVDYKMVPVPGHEVDVTFYIKEGERYKISKVQVLGLKEIDEDDILNTIQTKRYKWWNSWLLGTGRLNQEMLDNDRNLIMKYFMDHGFVDANVSKAAISKKDNNDIVVTFTVKEGVKYYFGNIDINSNFYELKKADILSKLKIQKGDVFSASELRDATFEISDILGDYSYAFANVEPKTSIKRETSQVDILFLVDKGRKVTINKINITGNDKTYDNVIRREFVISEGEGYSSRKIKRSERLLKRLGYFSEVNIATTALDDPSKVDLDVNVKESSTGSFSVGVGYSTSDGAILNTRFAEDNLFGTGRSLSLDVDVGTERNNAVLAYKDRRLNDSFWAFGAEALITDREYDDFDKKTLGGALSLGYPLEKVFGDLFEDIDFSVRYELLQVEISNVDRDAASFIHEEADKGKTISSAIRPQIVRNTLDNNYNPQDGSMQKLSFEYGGLGGDENYMVFEASNTFYHKLFEMFYGGDVIFSWRIDYGYGKGFDKDKNGKEKLPLFKRYFLGGINSVRGFKPRKLGPREKRPKKDKDGNPVLDENGNEVMEDGSVYGGAKELVNNLDVIFPIIPSAGLNGVLFYDMGQAYDDDESFDLGELRKAWGWGFRWISPLGPFPLRLEFGYPIDKKEGESSMVTMFSFGAPL